MKRPRGITITPKGMALVAWVLEQRKSRCIPEDEQDTERVQDIWNEAFEKFDQMPKGGSA